MRGLLWVVVAWAVLALPAAAEPRTCSATVGGAAGNVQVLLEVDGGRPLRGRANWEVAPDPTSMPGARLWLTREFSDPAKSELGRFTSIGVGAYVTAESPLPDRAVIAISSNTVEPIFRPWQTYTQIAAEVNSGRAPVGAAKDAEPVGFFGVIPISRGDAAADALLDSLETARTVIATASDYDGKVLLSRGLYWLNERDAFAEQARQAHAQALTAAQDPTRNCKAAESAGR